MSISIAESNHTEKLKISGPAELRFVTSLVGNFIIFSLVAKPIPSKALLLSQDQHTNWLSPKAEDTPFVNGLVLFAKEIVNIDSSG